MKRLAQGHRANTWCSQDASRVSEAQSLSLNHRALYLQSSLLIVLQLWGAAPAFHQTRVGVSGLVTTCRAPFCTDTVLGPLQASL